MLYFHPWEFDPQQARLPMKPLGRFRTYFGIHWSRPRLTELLSRSARYTFIRALDAVALLDWQQLPEFDLVLETPKVSRRGPEKAESAEAEF
jgi:hypothetical protein